MSIQPIDLQTLFTQMGQIGKEQAAQKEITVIQQDIQGNEIIKRNQHSDNSVNRADNSNEGPEKAKEDGSNGRKPVKKEFKQKKSETEKPVIKKEILYDPDIGKNIDFSG